MDVYQDQNEVNIQVLIYYNKIRRKKIWESTSFEEQKYDQDCQRILKKGLLYFKNCLKNIIIEEEKKE